jgi:hypothetical protein
MGDGKAIAMPVLARDGDGASGAAARVRLRATIHITDRARMPLLRLHLLRHGQTNASRGNLFCGRRLDPPLTRRRAGDGGVVRGGVSRSPLGGVVLQTARPRRSRRRSRWPTRSDSRADSATRVRRESTNGAWDGLSAPEVAERFRSSTRAGGRSGVEPADAGETAVALRTARHARARGDRAHPSRGRERPDRRAQGDDPRGDLRAHSASTSGASAIAFGLSGGIGDDHRVPGARPSSRSPSRIDRKHGCEATRLEGT